MLSCIFTACDANSFQCANDLCVPTKVKCDGNNDCSDYSDEQECGTLLAIMHCIVGDYNTSGLTDRMLT